VLLSSADVNGSLLILAEEYDIQETKYSVKPINKSVIFEPENI
jgi:hypothetical protein